MRKLWIAAPFALALSILAFAVSVAPADRGGHRGWDRGKHGLRAHLDGFQETPSISTTGRGDFKIAIRNGELEFRLRYDGLENPVTVAHIHFGQSRVAGGIIAHLCGGPRPACPQSGEVSGAITAADIEGPAVQGIDAREFDEVVRALKAGAVYANVHTSKFTAGEIRGQVGGGWHHWDD